MRFRSSCMLLACATLAGCSAVGVAPSGTTLVLRSVTVVDTESGIARPPQDVYIVGDRIASVRAAERRVPKMDGARIVDGSGKFLSPGLWDMHAHWWDEAYLPLFTLNGVTGIRQMRGYTVHHAWRAKGIEGTPAAPRTVLASPLVDGEPPIWAPSLAAATPAQARAAVRLVARSSADFVKTYDKIPRDAYLALLDEARKLDVRVEGHVPTAVGWLEAAKQGRQRSYEHHFGLEESLARNEEELVRAGMALEASYDANAGPTPAQRAEGTRLLRSALDHYDPARFDALAAVLGNGRSWMVPTLVLRAARIDRFKPGALADPRLKQMPPWIRQYWEESILPMDEVVHGDIDANRKRLGFYAERTRAMHDAGIPLLVGSDTGNPFVYPGTSVHEEMELFAEAGLPPLAVLQSATRNVGDFLQRKDIGVIRPGSVADLVLLDADPLADISNVRRISAVVTGGHLIDADARAAGFARMERIAVAPPIAPKVLEALGSRGADAAIEVWSAHCPAPPDVRNCDPGEFLDPILAALEKDANPARARDFIGWAEATFADNVRVQVWATEIHRERGRSEAARLALNRSLALAPGAPWLLRMESEMEGSPGSE